MTRDRSPLAPQLVALEIHRYKNLRDVWLPWGDGLALFGANGAGKTNLLECLTLLLGTGQAVGLAGPRLGTPGPDDLSLLARPGTAALPWPPDLVFEGKLFDTEEGTSLPGVRRGRADAAWWRMLGTDGAATSPPSLPGRSSRTLWRDT